MCCEFQLPSASEMTHFTAIKANTVVVNLLQTLLEANGIARLGCPILPGQISSGTHFMLRENSKSSHTHNGQYFPALTPFDRFNSVWAML